MHRPPLWVRVRQSVPTPVCAAHLRWVDLFAERLRAQGKSAVNEAERAWLSWKKVRSVAVASYQNLDQTERFVECRYRI